MIHGIYANQPSFHTVEFTTGLNIILADRKEDATHKDTRNGLGKSTLISIINFCLGASVRKGKGLYIESLADWVFTIDMTVHGHRVKASRSVSSPNRISIQSETPPEHWIRQPDYDPKTKEYVFSLDDWKALLGWACFGLMPYEGQLKYTPSYRSLVSYFIRNKPDAYSSPFHHFRNQGTGSIQLHMAFLLGLNWEYAAQWQELRDKEDILKAMQKAIKTGALDGIVGTIGELEAARIQLESILEQEQKDLSSFKVHHQYETIQAETNRLTQELHRITNANVVDRRKLSRYEEAVATETPPKDNHIESIYQETGLTFPDGLKRSLNEAKQFHETVVKNRRTFLEAEIIHLKKQIADRDLLILKLTEERAKHLNILKTHGAFEEFSRLEEEHVATREKLEQIKHQIETVRTITAKKQDIQVGRIELGKAAEIDYEERRSKWTSAVKLFNENSQALYKSPGALIIDISDKGYKFDVEIECSDSDGIGKMKIFCFDLMLAQLGSTTQHKVDFLIHDSIIYDGVDPRQRAHALERAATVAEKNSLQYICALNSDMIPTEDLSAGFDLDKHVRVRLTDNDPAGSLLGMRFR